MKIIFVGVSGFPFGLAVIEKQKIIARGLVENGNDVKIVCSDAEHSNKIVSRKGVFEEIKYYYTCPYTYKKKNVFLRRINRYIGAIYELFVLLFSNCDLLIVLSRNFFVVLKYKFISILKGIPLTMLVHEDNNIVKTKPFTIKALNQFLNEKYSFKILDAAFPISSYLEKDLRRKNQNLKQFLLPVLTDFDFIKRIKSEDLGKYFLFCGGATYYEIVEFIIDSYEKTDSKSYRLILICSGHKKHLEKIENRIKASAKSEFIELLSFLSYERLIKYYKSSSALLIPLRNNVQDIARFPHKVSEYCASGSPIITTRYGEISKFLKHKESCLIAEEYAPDSFSKQMNFIINNPKKSSLIGYNSLQKGKILFDYKNRINELNNFLKKI